MMSTDKIRSTSIAEAAEELASLNHERSEECEVTSPSPSDEFAFVDQADELVCDFCNTAVPCLAVSDHIQECCMFPVACPNKCDQLMARCDVIYHVDKVCFKSKVLCPYHSTGCVAYCPKQLQRSELQVHMTRSDVMAAALCGLLDTVNQLAKRLEQTEKELVELAAARDGKKLHLRTRKSL